MYESNIGVILIMHMIDLLLSRSIALHHMFFTTLSCAGSVVLTQTHPAAPYVCRTGNITLSCQYDGVEVLVVLWSSGNRASSNPSDIPGHTTLPRTTTYQEVVVDSYTNLEYAYHCTPILSNASHLQSNVYIPQIERECILPRNIHL